MSAPLPKTYIVPSECPPAAHSGLWYDKFCHRWLLDPAKRGLERWSLKSSSQNQSQPTNPKLDWILTVTRRKVGDEKPLAEHASRLAALVRGSGGDVKHFRTSGRFATGLGRAHPIENGFVWHPTLGVPYLPGSSVKGLVRAWATSWVEKANGHEAVIARIFGPRDLKVSSAQAGSVIFFDAIPTSPVQLAADVMTPHYGPYYEDAGGDTPPADWHSPVPIPFLTVAEGQSFVFALAARTASAQDREDCRTASKWLEEALRELGAGAKTAVGYGRLVPDEEAASTLRRAEEAARIAAREAEKQAAFTASLAQLGATARELKQAARDRQWETDGNAFKAPGVAEHWLERLETEPQPDAIACLREFFDRHFPGLLANPDKTEGKRNKAAFKPRWVALAKRLNAVSKP